ncbi:MAG: alpha/beta fold hydrolase [Thiobacillaceae bacterium]|nr:alpha/beta fold hydrolase [Thiobacillaceae bacterium]MCX7672956.1 alpha/beta fold hydrolase [Thiobacillaceae bacterium]MDW8324350.1 alpha/beta fold hydrolase [Burkholderiales bacterium]
MTPAHTPHPSSLTCLHGWGLGPDVWDDLRTRLPAWAIRTPALPGYDGGALPAPYRPETLADALARHEPAPGVLLGWSMGGMVALAWAARAPQTVRGLILVASTPVFVQRADWAAGLAPEVVDAFAAELLADPRATLLRFLALTARAGEAARAVTGRLRALLDRHGHPPATTLAAGLELLRTADLRPRLAAVRCPVLLVHGGHDALCPPAAAHWLAERLPQARLALHPHAAHAPFLSHPEWFAATVDAFLTELDAR